MLGERSSDAIVSIDQLFRIWMGRGGIFIDKSPQLIINDFTWNVFFTDQFLLY